MNLEELVPPFELCKKIPAGEFEDSALIHEDYRFEQMTQDGEIRENPERHIYTGKRSFTGIDVPTPELERKERLERHKGKPDEWVKICKAVYPAPTLQEILEELHKQQEDVFLKWSETAYHEWLVNAYTHNKDDYQAHNKSIVIAALKVWFEMKGVE